MTHPLSPSSAHPLTGFLYLTGFVVGSVKIYRRPTKTVAASTQ